MDGGQEATFEFPVVGDVVPLGVPARRRPKRNWRPVAAVVAVVAVLAGGVAYASTTDLWPRPAPEWDPAVEPLARFVEVTRGGTFEEPVEVVFNSRADYSEHFAVDRDEIDEEDEAEMARSVATMRALGWVAGDLDLVDTVETMGDSGTLGFYRPEDGRIHVRGGRQDLDVAMRVTLVHELTHAYDFSHFDLEVDEDEPMTSGESFAYEAVVEGSAKLVEWSYVESLPEAERALAYGEENADAAAPDADLAALDALPAVFLESMGMPYAVGPRFLQALAERAGDDTTKAAADRALQRWPRSEEDVVDLESYDRGLKPRDVARPKLREGEIRTDEEDETFDFGQLSLALLLAPHVGGDSAWRSVSGWAGDNTLSYRRGADGPHCLRVAVAFDNALRAAVFRSAAGSWARAIPGATVGGDTAVADVVELDTCDPGPAGPAVPEPAGATVTEVVMVRHDLLAGLVAEGVPAPVATCVRDRVLDGMGVARFLELDGRMVADPGDAEAERLVGDAFGRAARDCGFDPGG